MKRSMALCVVVNTLLILHPAGAVAGVDNLALSPMYSTLTARSAGMGDCAVGNVDSDALLYNPGAFGVYHLTHDVAFTIPIRTVLIPGITNDLTVSVLSAGFRVPSKYFGSSAGRSARWTLALGVSHSRWTIPHFEAIYPPFPPDHEYSTNLTVATAHSGVIRVGAGFTLKFISADLKTYGAGSDQDPQFSNHGAAFDVGLFAEVDLHNVGTDRTLRTSKHWLVVPSLAIVRANAGGDRFAYLYLEQEDPLPEMTRYSAGVKIGTSHGDREDIIVRFLYEYDDWVAPRTANKFGGELGIANAFFARIGHIKEMEWRDLTTYGAGFSFAGLYDWIKGGTATASSGFWERVDIRFDYARYGNDRTQAEERTSFFGLGFSISE